MGAVAAAAGMLGQLGGSVLQAKAALDEGDAAYRAGMENARLSLDEGYAEETRRRREARREMGRERLVFAKAGLRAEEGSPLDLLASNAAEFEREALDARLTGLREYTLQRRAARTTFKRSRRAAASSILSGIGGGLSSGSRMFGGGS